MLYLNFLADGVASLPYQIIKYVLIGALAIMALLLIIIVLLQPGNTAGLGEIGGGMSESFMNKNKGKTIEGRLKKLTVILAICFIVGILALTILMNNPF